MIYRRTTPLWAICAALLACSSSEGRPDEELGGLVRAEHASESAIDLDDVASDPAALMKVIALPHHRVSKLLGPHTFHGTSRIEIFEGKAAIDKLDDDTKIDLDDDGNYRAALENSRDYGREVVYVDGTMYLRPRFGKYHRRPPADPEEPARVRDQIYGTLAAYFEPLAVRAELTDAGGTSVAGRAARIIKIKTAPESAKAPPEEFAQRKWREKASVESVEGEVALDKETGVPLRATLSGRLNFQRDGKTFSMSLSVTHTFEQLGKGKIDKVAAPPADRTVETYQRIEEFDEREALLRGIAPPARRAPTPQNPTGEEQATAPR